MRTINMYNMLAKHVTAEYTSTHQEHGGMLAEADNDEYIYKCLNPNDMEQMVMHE